MKRNTILAILTSTVVATGCATTGSPMTSSDAPLAPLDGPAMVEVHNHNWSDMVVYAVHHNTRIRLGMVTSMNTERFAIPARFEYASSDLRLVAAPIGAVDEFSTPPIMVAPGQRVELRLENLLSISNWSVW